MFMGVMRDLMLRRLSVMRWSIVMRWTRMPVTRMDRIVMKVTRNADDLARHSTIVHVPEGTAIAPCAIPVAVAIHVVVAAVTVQIVVRIRQVVDLRSRHEHQLRLT